MTNVGILKDISLFAGLDEPQVVRFAQITEEKKCKSGDIILEQGVEGDALYVVKEGQVEVSKSEGEVRSTLVTLEVGEHFGEMSLLEGQPTSARVSADGDVTLLIIPREKFLKLLNEDIAIGQKVYRSLAYVLSKRLRSTSADLATWKPSFDL